MCADIMCKANNDVFSRYVATEIALILVLYLGFRKDTGNEIIDLLVTLSLYILYHIIIFFSFYYGVRVIYYLRKYNIIRIFLFIGTFAVNFILLALTVTSWLVVIFELS